MKLFQSQILVSTTSNGSSKFWCIFVQEDEQGRHYTNTESWHTLEDGIDSKHMLSAPSYVTAKNIGHSNETTTLQQAMAEAQSAIDLKKQKGYHLLDEKVQSHYLLPMLANRFEERKHYLSYPVALQRKMNGVRCLMDGKVAWSRQGNEFIPEVVKHIIFDTKGLILDGELVLPEDEYSFQETISAVKKYRSSLSEKLEYVIYDMVEPTIQFSDRLSLLEKLKSDMPPQVRLLTTSICESEEQIHEWHKLLVSHGAEGVIVRNLAGKYKLKDRSNDLLKLKFTKDADYKIVDIEQGIAKHTGCAIFVCETEQKRFSVTPKMTIPVRQEIWKNKEKYIGKKLTVVYQALSDDGIPMFGRGIEIRDYE